MRKQGDFFEEDSLKDKMRVEVVNGNGTTLFLGWFGEVGVEPRGHSVTFVGSKSLAPNAGDITARIHIEHGLTVDAFTKAEATQDALRIAAATASDASQAAEKAKRDLADVEAKLNAEKVEPLLSLLRQERETRAGLEADIARINETQQRFVVELESKILALETLRKDAEDDAESMREALLGSDVDGARALAERTRNKRALRERAEEAEKEAEELRVENDRMREQGEAYLRFSRGLAKRIRDLSSELHVDLERDEA